MHCLTLIGGASVAMDGATPIALDAKRAALLALAALGDGLSRAGAAQMLWPAAPRQAALGNLRVLIHRLHDQVGARLIAAGEPLRLDESVCGFEMPDQPPALDIAVGDTRHRWRLLGTMADTECDEFDRWRTRLQSRIERHWLERMAACIAQCRADGRLREAIAVASQRVQLQPVSESLRCELMHLHMVAGDRTAALHAYEDCRRMLFDELGVRPSAATETLHLQLLRMSDCSRPAGAIEEWELHAPQLVQRDVQLMQMDRDWSQQRHLFVCGEGGIGKTRLLREFARWRQLVQVCLRPGDKLVPFAATARLLRGVAQQLAAQQAAASAYLLRLADEASGTADARVDAGRFVEALLGPWHGIDGIVVDDMHHADTKSALVLARVVSEGATESMRLIVGWRPAEVDADFDRTARDVVAAGRGARVDVGLLDSDGVRELLVQLPLPWLQPDRHAAQLAGMTGGNPMFVLELLRESAQSDAPGEFAGIDGGLKPLLQARAQRCSAAARSLLAVALVAGSQFSVALAAGVLNVASANLAEPWRELELAGLFGAGGLAHDLVADALRDSVPEAIRIDLHGQVARWLADHRGDPLLIVQHALQGRQSAHALAHVCAAAEQLAARGLDHEAAALLADVALPPEGEAPHPGSWDALCSLSRLADPLDNDDRLVRLPALMHRLASGPEQQAHALLAEGCVISCTDSRRAVPPLERALALAAQGSTLWLQAGLVLAYLQALNHDRAAARAVMAALPADFDAGLSPKERYEALRDAGVVHDEIGNHQQAMILLRRSIRAARRMADTPFQHEATGHLCLLLRKLAMHRASRRGLESCLRAAQRWGVSDGGLHSLLERRVAVARMHDGEFSAALDHLRRAQQCAPHGVRASLTRLTLARLYLHVGQLGRARAELVSVPTEHPEVGVTYPISYAEHALPVLRAAGDDVSTALAMLRRQAGRLEADQEAEVLLLEALAIDDAAQQLELAGRACELAGASGLAGPRCAAHLLAANALHAMGRHGAALVHARSALPLLRRGRVPYSCYVPELWLWCARVLQVGERALAREAVHAAQHWVARSAAHVPDEWRDSFLHRHPTHLALRALAERLGA